MLFGRRFPPRLRDNPSPRAKASLSGPLTGSSCPTERSKPVRPETTPVLTPISHHHGRLQVSESENVIPRIVISRKINDSMGNIRPLKRANRSGALNTRRLAVNDNLRHSLLLLRIQTSQQRHLVHATKQRNPGPPAQRVGRTEQNEQHPYMRSQTQHLLTTAPYTTIRLITT